MAGGQELSVVLLDRLRRRRADPARLRRVLQRAARVLRVSGEVALVLAGDRTLRRLNRAYRGKDRATDVLSFPGARGGHAVPPASKSRRRVHWGACEGGKVDLGDILISVETAQRNARSLGRSLPQELDVLALHGFLHVLGYDHEADDGTMDQLERRLRLQLLGHA